jgi:tetratricopeptide (TPR) repeat protein
MPSAEKIRAMLEREPNDVFLNFGLAMELSKNDLDAALAQFDHVIQIDPDYCGAYFHKGKTLIAAGRDDEGRQELRRGIETANRIGDAHAAGEMTELLESL